MDLKNVLTFIIFLSLLSILGGCGGGSIGTGTEPRTSFSGAVSNEKGTPLANVQIELRETGEKTTSAADGSFLLESVLAGGDATFQVSIATVNDEVQVSDLPSNGAAVQLDLTVNLRNQEVSLDNVSITAKIEGACDPYFENNRTIRQAQSVPDGTICPLRVRVKKNGVGLSGVPFLLQRSRCFDGAPWHDIEFGTTSQDPAGFGEISFAFSNAEEFCVYRVVIQGSEIPEVFTVETFRKQAFDQGQEFNPNSGDGR